MLVDGRCVSAIAWHLLISDLAIGVITVDSSLVGSANDVESELLLCAHEVLMAHNWDYLDRCRVPLLAALHWDRIPGYHYNAMEDCHFWANYGRRDRTVEFSRELDFNRHSAYRLSDPFVPPLTPNGTALYIGAHREGEDGLALRERYGLRLHVFEPSRSFFPELVAAVGNASGVTLHNYGLGARTRVAQLQLSGTGSTTMPEGRASHPEAQAEEVLIRSTEEVVQDLFSDGHLDVELLHVNCEGCEYEVVDGLWDISYLKHVSQIQIATHLLESPAETLEATFERSLELSVSRYCQMHRALAATHDRIWGLPWVWERWTRKVLRL